eukprot:403338718
MSTSSQVHLYGDYGSQPTRAVYVLLAHYKIPFTFHQVNVGTLDQYKPEYKKINPNAKVPAMVDKLVDGSEVVLYESHTIMRYIFETRQLPDHLYPKDNHKLRAKIDEYLDWHHNGLRLGAGGYIFRKYISPLTGKPAPKEAIVESLALLKRALKLMDTYWLSNSEYLVGNQLTLADISAACELNQITASNQAPLIEQFPKVSKWLKKINEELPAMKEVNDKGLPMLAKYFKKIDKQEQEQAKL